MIGPVRLSTFVRREKNERLQKSKRLEVFRCVPAVPHSASGTKGVDMECVLTFFFAIAVLIMLAAFGTSRQSKASRRNQTYYNLARRFHGVALPGGWFGHPSIRFPYGVTTVTLSTVVVAGSKNVEGKQVKIPWPESSFQLEVFPRRTGGGSNPFRRMSEFPSGYPAFDEHFVLQSNNPDEAKTVLSEAVCWEIERLREFLGDDNMQVSIKNGTLVIRKLTHMYRYDTLERFTQLCLELFDQAMLTRSVGIEFLDQGDAQLIKEAKCQVCGESIEADLVFCPRCKTPHHRECWQYYGACTTYGCAETNYCVPGAPASGVSPASPGANQSS